MRCQWTCPENPSSYNDRPLIITYGKSLFNTPWKGAHRIQIVNRYSILLTYFLVSPQIKSSFPWKFLLKCSHKSTHPWNHRIFKFPLHSTAMSIMFRVQNRKKCKFSQNKVENLKNQLANTSQLAEKNFFCCQEIFINNVQINSFLIINTATKMRIKLM